MRLCLQQARGREVVSLQMKYVWDLNGTALPIHPIQYPFGKDAIEHRHGKPATTPRARTRRCMARQWSHALTDFPDRRVCIAYQRGHRGRFGCIMGTESVCCGHYSTFPFRAMQVMSRFWAAHGRNGSGSPRRSTPVERPVPGGLADQAGTKGWSGKETARGCAASCRVTSPIWVPGSQKVTL